MQIKINLLTQKIAANGIIRQLWLGIRSGKCLLLLSFNGTLTVCLPVSSADNLGKQFRPNQARQKVRLYGDTNCLTLKEPFENVYSEQKKDQWTTEKEWIKRIQARFMKFWGIFSIIDGYYGYSCSFGHHQ